MRDMSLADRVRNAVGGLVGEITEKIGMGSEAEKIRRDALGLEAIEAGWRAVQASDNLGETVASMRASDLAARHILHAVEPASRSFEIPMPPPNPIHETNKLLQTFKDRADEMRPTFIRTVELIQTLTETALAVQALANANAADAERQSRRSMTVAIWSIVLTLLVGGISIYYAYSSPTGEQIDKIAAKFSAQMKAAAAADQASRDKYERQAADDRAALMKLVSQQEALIAELKKPNEKHDLPKSNTSK